MILANWLRNATHFKKWLFGTMFVMFFLPIHWSFLSDVVDSKLPLPGLVMLLLLLTLFFSSASHLLLIYIFVFVHLMTNHCRTAEATAATPISALARDDDCTCTRTAGAHRKRARISCCTDNRKARRSYSAESATSSTFLLLPREFNIIKKQSLVAIKIDRN